ncbi:MAG: hypothetical protein MUE40_18600 [Anaerolineae bacterium]|nr:hypothetical protein [Anaerolineae bacterium]
MKFGRVPLSGAVGGILAHKLVDAAGSKILGKGRLLSAADVALLHSHGYDSVVVARLDSTDLGENEAAQRVGAAVAGAGPGVRVVAPGVGRANVLATTRGVLRVNVPVLERLNNIDMGITIATRYRHTLVNAGDLVALVKIVPFGIAAARVLDVETMAQQMPPVLAVDALRPAQAALIVSGPESARAELLAAFTGPVQQRLTALGSTLAEVLYTAHTPAAIAAAITAQQPAGRDLVLVAGISAIIDQEDVVPQALRLAGGTLTHLGVPVDPGSLLMLGYVEHLPVIGTPGCIKSPKTSVIDWILPRLLTGERLTRADLVALGHGGLLDDIADRPLPRGENDD